VRGIEAVSMIEDRVSVVRNLSVGIALALGFESALLVVT